MTLPSRMADFVPRDRKLQNAYCRDHVAVTEFLLFCVWTTNAVDQVG
mgnify:CR=1 FL=1